MASIRSRYRAWVPLLAGPVAIVVAVVIVLHAVAFGGRINDADVRTLWLPTYCFLGRSLAAGHIPGWNPFILSGAPFVADPQSGWLYLPAMALFSVARCDVAIRMMVVLQPVLAGLGMLWFFRSEGLSRHAAVTAGLVLALAVAGSSLAVSLPFSATLAWTALLLAVASRYLRASVWPARLGWCVLAALAWGQVAGALLSDGLDMATIALAVFLITKAWTQIRRRAWTPWFVLGLFGILAAAMVTVNLAVLLPRLVYLRETSLAHGYGYLQDVSARLLGKQATGLVIGPTSTAHWPLKFATSPGLHVGAIALALSLAGLGRRSVRPMVVGFMAYGTVAYLLTLRVVAHHVPHFTWSQRVVDLYLHAPQRWGVAVVLAIAVLAGSGVEAWRGANSNRARLLMAGPGVVVWWVLPLVLGASPGEMALLGAGAMAGMAVAVVATKRPALTALLPAVLAVELVVSPFLGVGTRSFEKEPSFIEALPPLDRSAAAYLRPGPIAAAVSRGPRGRSMAVGRPAALQAAQAVEGAGFLNQAEVLRIENTEGYNSAQLFRFWLFNRLAEGSSINYQLSSFSHPSSQVLDLLQVTDLLTPVARPPQPGSTPLATQEGWGLYQVQPASARASVVGSWTVSGSSDPVADAALQTVTDPGFDPSAQVVLERDPGLGASPGPAGAAGSASYRMDGNQAATVVVDASTRGVVLIRTPFDPGWHAKVDGRAAPILRADYLLQGVAVLPGRHVVQLRYDDPWVGYGLAGSAGALLAFGLAALLLRPRRNRRAPALTAPPGPVS